MSSNDKGILQEGQDTHKNATRRPCDVCRRRKIRCVNGDGSQMPGSKCYTCLDGNLECTYLVPAKKRVSKSGPYITELEIRVKSLEPHVGESKAIILQLRTQIARLCEELAAAQVQLSGNSALSTISTHSSLPSDVERNVIGSISTSTEQQHDARSAALHTLRTGLHSVSEPPPAPHPDDLLDPELECKCPFHTDGRVDNESAAMAAFDLKEDVRRGERRTEPTPESYPNGVSQYVEGTGPTRRPEYWMSSPWENTAPTRTHTYRLPPPDLIAHLAELYFTRAHIYLPVLHRQTFERSVEVGMHHWDDGFAAVLLLVCAIGSRWSDDPRVLLPAGKGKPHVECGWQWFNQITPALSGNHFLRKGTLCDLQYYCLAGHFLLSSATREPAGWMLVGIGLRLAQDAGAHLRTAHAEAPTVERELWKRSFWVLVYLDLYLSSLMGRTCAIQYDDFDVEPPIECDDEYWQDPTHPFQQPPGMPSRIAFFNALLRLSHILAFTLKVLYSLGKSRSRFTADDGWEEHFVVDLDSALNRWRDQVPEHLSWDPARADSVFFDQSVALHCRYCHLQIMVHRLFPTVRKAVPTGIPSMTVCTNAARACASMVDVQRRRNGNEPNAFNLSDVFSSALILLLNVWSGTRTGQAASYSRDLENVHKCMVVLRLCEDRWMAAGMLCDILAELTSAAQPPVQSSSFSFAQAYGDAVASDTAQPISSEELEMSRMIFKSPILQQTYTSTSHGPQCPPYAAAPEDFTIGVQIAPCATGAWFASEAPVSMDPSSDARAMIDIYADERAHWIINDWGTQCYSV
ncbi:fungal-specific transcription factor domain-containing protein [Mycena epipterygia]|nr:fungal-specific transcription factor domain-containing protein [Mycena epipterygia]